MDSLVFLITPGEKTSELKRISKMMLLTEPTSLQAARTASLARVSSEKNKRKRGQIESDPRTVCAFH